MHAADSAPQPPKRRASRAPVFFALVVAALALVAGILLYRRFVAPHSASPAGESAPARRHFENGLQRAREGNLVGAIRLWETAIALEPTFAPPYFALAKQAAESGDMDAAIRRLNALRAANPRAPHVDCTQTGLYFQMGRVWKALTAAREATQREPDCAQAHSLLGMALASAGDRPGAIQALQTARRLDPASERVTLTLAQVLAQAGRTDEAAQLVRPLVDAPSVSASAHYLYAWLLAEHGRGGKRDLETAKEHLEKALSLEPGHVASRSEQGIVLARLGDYAAARPRLESALKSGAIGPETLTALADVYERLGDPRAKSLRQQAQALKATQEERQQARARYLKAPKEMTNILRLARLEAQSGNRADALDLVRTALQIDPNRADALALFHRLRAAPPASSPPGP